MRICSAALSYIPPFCEQGDEHPKYKLSLISSTYV